MMMMMDDDVLASNNHQRSRSLTVRYIECIGIVIVYNITRVCGDAQSCHAATFDLLLWRWTLVKLFNRLTTSNSVQVVGQHYVCKERGQGLTRSKKTTTVVVMM